MDPKRLALVDQAVAGLVQILPITWRRLHDGCKEHGFTEEHADKLICMFTVMLVKDLMAS